MLSKRDLKNDVKIDSKMLSLIQKVKCFLWCFIKAMKGATCTCIIAEKNSLFMYFFCNACMLNLYPHESLEKVFLKLFTCYKIYFTLQINIISDNDYLKLNIILMVAGIYAIL